jgi:hypothetical protein
MQFEGENPQNLRLGSRISSYLRGRFGRDAAKHSARMTGVDLRTARGWVEEGREPRGEALLAIIKDMGRDGLLAMFSPEIEAHADRLERQIDELEQEAARLRACLESSQSPSADMVSANPCAVAHPFRRKNDFAWRSDGRNG